MALLNQESLDFIGKATECLMSLRGLRDNTNWRYLQLWQANSVLLVTFARRMTIPLTTKSTKSYFHSSTMLWLMVVISKSGSTIREQSPQT